MGDKWDARYIQLCAWFRMDLEKLKASDEFFAQWDTFFIDLKKALDIFTKQQRANRPPALTVPVATTRRRAMSNSLLEARIGEPSRPWSAATSVSPSGVHAGMNLESGELGVGGTVPALKTAA